MFNQWPALGDEEPPSSPKPDTSAGLFDQLSPHLTALTAEQLEAVRARIRQVVQYQAVVGVLGKTGAGKSSLCNALFGQETASVSDVEACTRHPQEITLSYQNGKGLSLLDVPGVGESTTRDADYTELYASLMKELDLILWVIKADDRALSVDEQVYRDIVQPYADQHQVPVIFVINQVDKIEPSREWDWQRNLPGPRQAANIETKRASVSRQLGVSPSQVCAVSAEAGYQLMALIDTVISVLPAEKRWSIAREAREEHVSKKSRQAAEQGLWESIKSSLLGIVVREVAIPLANRAFSAFLNFFRR